MNARVVPVSGVPWTFFTSSHAFRCGGEEGWDHYRLGHPAAEVLAELRLMYSQATVRSRKVQAVLRWDRGH